MKNINFRKYLLLVCSIAPLSSCSLFNNSSGTDEKKEPDNPTPVTYPDIVISQDEGYKVKFNNIGAAYYKVVDDNDYRSDITIGGNKTDEYFYYEPEVVGKHNIYVEAYNARNERIKYSKDFDTVEVEPVLSYSPFAMHYSSTKANLGLYDIPLSVWDDAESRYGKMDSHYFYLNDNLEWTARGALSEGEKTGTFSIVEESDFSRTSMMDKIMKNLKEAGNNVILLHEKYAFLENYTNWSWWYKSDTDNCLLRIMNTAWKYGIKCIITDAAIMGTCLRGTEKFTGNLDSLKSEVQSIVSRRFLHSVSSESNMQNYLRHKAFYGLNFPDEPFPDSATYYAIGYASQKINELYSSTGALNKLTKPVIFTSILPYANFIFSGKSDYKNYVKKYNELTQCDFVGFDLYTYTTMSYGTNKAGDYHCNVKVAFEVYNELKKDNPNLKVCQTINCGNDQYRMTQTYADVYASHMLAAASKFYGYGLFTFSPFDVAGTWINTAVTYKQEKTENYVLIQDANLQVIKLKGLLSNFDIDSMVIDQNPTNEYGYGKKLLTTSFVNGTKTAKMYVNYETDLVKKTDVSYSITIEKGHEYYLFGKDKSCQKTLTQDNITIVLDKAETLVVF